MNLGILFQPLKQYSFYLLLALIVLGEVLFATTVLPRQLNTINDDRAKLGAVNSEISDLSQTLDYLTKIDRGTLDSLLIKASAALPDEKKTSGLVTGLAKLASSSGALMKSLEFSPGLISTKAASLSTTPPNPNTQAIQGGGIKTLEATMVLSGDSNSLIIFLAKLDKASQLLGVSRLKYTVNPSEGNQSDIGLFVFYQPPAQATVLWRESSPLTDQEKKILDEMGSKDIFTLQ